MGSYSFRSEFPGSLEEIDFNNLSNFPVSNEALGLGNGFYLDDQPLLDLASLNIPSALPEPYSQNSVPADSSSFSDDPDFSDSVLKYISQVLMEEDMAEKPCMFHDALSLQAAEKSLYEALGEKYPYSPDQQPHTSPGQWDYSPDVSFSSDYGNTSNITTSSDSHWSLDGLENRPSWLQTPIPNNFVFHSSSRSTPRGLNRDTGGGNNGVLSSGFSDDLVSSMFNDSDLAIQFRRGVEEASKFLPKSSQLLINPASGSKEKGSKEGEREHESVPYRLTGKKSHWREDEHLAEERSNKQSAVYVEENELSEMFDKVLLFGRPKEQPVCILHETFPKDPTKFSSFKTQKGETTQPSETKNNGKKLAASGNNSKQDTADLRTLLVSCAQAVSVDDRITAHELIRQVRLQSSPLGNGAERLAHYFANSLEARLSGTGTQIYTALSSKRTSTADMLKAYHTFISVCPFKKIAIIFANHSLMHLAVAKNAKTIHIIDFGISYGFQWPALIHRLAWRPGGPPKLRITGIDLPQRGFRPAQGVIETGERLARYCQRFNVPFEYNAIAQKWETIKLEDLKIREGEFIAVNSLFRLRNLLDETVAVNCPRDAVLKLIRKVNPDIFIPAILSGSYNAPFFVTRFRELLFHFSSLFDMCDTNLSREDDMRLMFEKEFYGREIMNVVACEGSERVERPESYKQWQARAMRAGFRPLPLD